MFSNDPKPNRNLNTCHMVQIVYNSRYQMIAHAIHHVFGTSRLILARTKRAGAPAILEPAMKAAAAKLVQLATGQGNLARTVSGRRFGGQWAVNETKGVIRSHRFAFEEVHGVEVDIQSPFLACMVRHAGSMISRDRRGLDGRIAWELRSGKP